MITVYNVAYNEEKLLPLMHKLWKERFPKANFVLYDNNSTDGTIGVAKELGYRVFSYNTGNTFDDKVNLMTKNLCYRNSPTDWVAVCDLDEIVDISEKELKEESKKGATIINTQGWHVSNLNDMRGVKDDRYSKKIMFNRVKIPSMGWDYGQHGFSPYGIKKMSDGKYNLLHIKYLNEEDYIERCNLYRGRIQGWNKEVGHGKQYELTEQQQRENFKEIIKHSIDII